MSFAQLRDDLVALDDFNPDEPRDEGGKWTGGGGERFQSEVHKDVTAKQLKALAHGNAAGIARFVIYKDGSINAGDAHKFTHLDIAPADGAWAVRGYVRHNGGNDFSYTTQSPFGGPLEQVDHPSLRRLEKGGIILGNPLSATDTDMMRADAFDPGEPRDASGKWTGGAGVARKVAVGEERKAKLGERRALMEKIKTYANRPGGGLTKEEGAHFDDLHRQMSALEYELASPGDTDKVAPASESLSALSPATTVAAYDDTLKSRPVFMALRAAAAGVAFDADTAVDKIMNGQNPEVSAQEFYDTFADTREHLRMQFGPTLTLYRSEGKQKAKATKNWATTREFAAQFGGNIKTEKIPVENVVGAFVNRNGKYHELIIGTPPKPAETEGDWKSFASGLNTTAEKNIEAAGHKITRVRVNGRDPGSKLRNALPLFEEEIRPNTTWGFIPTPKGIAHIYMASGENNGVELFWLHAVDRGAGHAAMEMIAEAADKVGSEINGDVIPLPAQGEGKKLTKRKLEAWYKKFGFKITKRDEDGTAHIVRKPKGHSVAADWDESQHPRGQPENAGEFVKGAGTGKGIEFVSPNIREGTHLKEAKRGLKQARHKFIVNAAEEVDKALGVEADVHPVIGMWADGAENSTMSIMENPPWETLVNSAAMKGWLAKQKQVLIFKEGDTDPKHGEAAGLASFSAKGKPEEISQWLGENGLPYHTLEPTKGGFTVHVYGNDNDTGHALVNAGEHYGSQVTVREGRGAFLGTHKEDGSDAEQRADARAEFDRLLGQSGDQKTAAVWKKLRDRLGPQADQVVSDQTETPHFQAWFGNSKIVDEDGAPLVLYHGTLGDFESFDKSRANVEGNWGAGIYFTNDPNDLSSNYAGRGPDITGRLENMADLIEQEDDFEGDHAAALQRAEKLLKVQHEGAAIPVFLKMEQPFKIGGKDETHLDFELPYDEETEEFGEPKGKAQDLIDAIREIGKSEEYSDNEGVDNLVNDLSMHAMDNDGIQASKLELIASGAANFGYVSDMEGKLAASDILRKALQKIGFDGVIDTRVSQKFSRMGLKPDSAHYIVFDPHQVKSAIGNTGKFDPKSTKITDSMYAHDAYNPNEARIPKGQPGAGQWTSGGGGLGFVKDDKVSNDSFDVWHHGAGTLKVQKATGAWKFANKQMGKEFAGDDPESLSKFIYENRNIFNAPKATGDPKTEGTEIIKALDVLFGDKLLSHGQAAGWKTYESPEGFMFHVNPETGEYKWKPPKQFEAVTGTGLHDFLDDMSQTTTSKTTILNDKAKELLDALPKPPVEWKPHPAAMSDMPNPNAEKLAAKLEQEFVEVAPELDAMAAKLYKDESPVETTEEEEEEASQPTEWDELSDEQKIDAEQKWKSNNHSDFYDSEVQSYFDSGQPLHSAKEDLAAEGDGAEYMDETIQEFLADWAGDPDDPVPVPYNKAQLLEATNVSFTDKYDDGQSDPEFTFDDDALKEPNDLTYDPATQGVLPGFPMPGSLASHFTKEMREDLADRLVTAFNKQADKDASNMEAPDYLSDSVDESLGDYWDQMEDEQKFKFAENELVLDDVQKQKEAKVEKLDHPPRKYDPLSFNSHSDDYTRTRHISHALSIARATDVLTKRGLLKVRDVDMTARLAEGQTAWKTWSNQGAAEFIKSYWDIGKNRKPHDSGAGDLLYYSDALKYQQPLFDLPAEDDHQMFIAQVLKASKVVTEGPGKGLVSIDPEKIDEGKYRNTFNGHRAMWEARLGEAIASRKKDLAASPEDARAKVNEIDSKMWRDWVGSSTSFGGKMIQIASADEFGGMLRIPGKPTLEPEPIKEATTVEAIKGFGEKNSTENADLREAIHAHLRELVRKPEILRKLPHDGTKAEVIPGLVQAHMKLSAGDDGDVKIDLDLDNLLPQDLKSVEPIAHELDRAIRRGVEQRRLDINAVRKEDAEYTAKAKYGGYTEMNPEVLLQNLKANTVDNPYRIQTNVADWLSDVGIARQEGPARLAGLMAKQAVRNATVENGKLKLDYDSLWSHPSKPENSIDAEDLKGYREKYGAELEAKKAGLLGVISDAFDRQRDERNRLAKKSAVAKWKEAADDAWDSKDKLIQEADSVYSDIGGYEGVKALMRAKWETTQWMMAKAGVHEFSAYRAILDPNVNKPDIEKVTVEAGGKHFTKLPGYTLVRNGAASTALKASVSNNWHSHKGGDADRVVLRVRMPRTAALSVPSYGQNEAAEREVIVMGTAWKAWDAFKEKAPEFDDLPIDSMPKSKEPEPKTVASEYALAPHEKAEMGLPEAA